MCGRYALGLRPSIVRRQLEDAGMPVEEAPEDDDVRQSYNFAPGYHGLVYRADVPDYGAGERHQRHRNGEQHEDEAHDTQDETDVGVKETRYKMQAMKWGLIPFWTKRNPDYGSMLKTINCRDDSLMENRGMWNTMKQKKRCIVVCQGFYEWLKKNGGKEKVPHFVKRKDDQLMCLAGLWDCAQYEGSDEKLYTYTIITTSSNEQLRFLHDRMPVILDNGSEDIRTWLDPKRAQWSKELQSLLKPYRGELECYPVSKDVGKVGNNSPTFIVPISSTENKNNIANFFGSAKKSVSTKSPKKGVDQAQDATTTSPTIKHEAEDNRMTVDQDGTEDNAPLPMPKDEVTRLRSGVKREHSDGDDHQDGMTTTSPPQAAKKTKKTKTSKNGEGSPEKAASAVSTRKTRSATSNGSKRSPVKAANAGQRITKFFN